MNDNQASPAELEKLKTNTPVTTKLLLRWALYTENPQAAQSYLVLAASDAVKARDECERLQLEIGKHENLIVQKSVPAIKRMWINQPSETQTYHDLHGTNVLAVLEHDNTYRVYFLSGHVISSQIDHLALSPGWRE